MKNDETDQVPAAVVIDFVGEMKRRLKFIPAELTGDVPEKIRENLRSEVQGIIDGLCGDLDAAAVDALRTILSETN